MLIGDTGLKTLLSSRVAIFGLGGVGGYVAEALARSGVGALDLIDHDKVAISNLNRQIIATHETVGKYKTEVMEARILSICPDTRVRCFQTFYLPETADQFDFSSYDYVVDAIDTVSGKIALILQAKKAGTPVISSMGAGNKLDPTKLCVADIYETSICPLARVMRRELKKRAVSDLKVVYSKEPALTPLPLQTEDTSRRQTPGSTAFVPAVAGLLAAAEVVKDLIRCGFDARQLERTEKERAKNL